MTSAELFEAWLSGLSEMIGLFLPRPELAAPLGGHLLTREKEGRFIPERAVYRVVLSVSPRDMQASELDQHAWRGDLTIHGSWEAPLWRYVRQALSVLIREWGF